MKKFMALSLATALSLSSVFAANNTQRTGTDSKIEEPTASYKPKKQEKLNRIRNISALSTTALIALAHYLSNKGMLPNVGQNASSDQNLVMDGPDNTPKAREGFEYLSTSYEETPSWKTLFSKDQPPAFEPNEQNIAPLQVDTALLEKMASLNPAAAADMVNFYKEKYPSLGWLSTKVEDSIQEHLTEFNAATTPEDQKALLDTLVREVANDQTFSCLTPTGLASTEVSHPSLAKLQETGVLCHTDKTSYQKLLDLNNTGVVDNFRANTWGKGDYSVWLGEEHAYSARSLDRDRLPYMKEATAQEKIVIQDPTGQAYEKTIADLMKADARPVVVSQDTAEMLKEYYKNNYITNFDDTYLPDGSCVVSLNQEKAYPVALSIFAQQEVDVQSPNGEIVRTRIGDLMEENAMPAIVSKEVKEELFRYYESFFSGITAGIFNYIQSFKSVELADGSYVVSLNQNEPTIQNAIGNIEIKTHYPNLTTKNLVIKDLINKKGASFTVDTQTKGDLENLEKRGLIRFTSKPQRASKSGLWITAIDYAN